MAFHHDYWVVVGTAAPIVLLATTLNVTGTAIAALRAQTLDLPRAKVRGFLKDGRQGFRYGILGLFATMISFGQALVALGREQDAGVYIAGILLGLGVLAQVGSALFIGLVEMMRLRIGDRPDLPKEERRD